MNHYGICLRAREQDRFSSWCSQERPFRLIFGVVRRNKLSIPNVSVLVADIEVVTQVCPPIGRIPPMYICMHYVQFNF